jgi:putative endonuclease
MEHNRGRTRSTRNYSPFEVVYKKWFDTRIQARNYEKLLKVRSNKEKLLKILGFLK